MEVNSGFGAARNRVMILGAGGRDLHKFKMVCGDDPAAEVLTFGTAQIPGFARRRYPPSLPAGARFRRLAG